MTIAAVAWRAVIRHRPLLNPDFETEFSTLGVISMTSTLLSVDIVNLSRRVFSDSSTSNYNAQSSNINAEINPSKYPIAKSL